MKDESGGGGEQRTALSRPGRQDAGTRDRTGGSRGEQMQEAARSEPDGGKARQLLHQLLPATSRLGRRHGKRPFSTTGDKPGQTAVKVNSLGRQGRHASALLVLSTLRVIKPPQKKRESRWNFFETANEMLICWAQGQKRPVQTSEELFTDHVTRKFSEFQIYG